MEKFDKSLEELEIANRAMLYHLQQELNQLTLERILKEVEDDNRI